MVVGLGLPTVMLRRHAGAQRRTDVVGVAASLVGGALGPAVPLRGPQTSPARPSGPVVIDAPIAGLDPAAARLQRGRYVVSMSDGRQATLTLEPNWQRATMNLLAQHALPFASVVVLDSATARVLVYASRGAGSDLARRADPPAASVFKMVTSSALLARGFDTETSTCYSGGFHALTPRDLIADPRRDHDCVTLTDAFAHSINTVFARRALERLHPEDELDAARRWGFGAAIPFDAAVEASGLEIPSDTLGFARTAAGFWHSHLSPLHGALLAQGVAAGGEMSRPWIVESLRDGRGIEVAVGQPRVWQRAVSPEVAAGLSHMMLRTVTDGTGFHGFHDLRGRSFLDDITVGGKTGTLTQDTPYRAYTWFVGNAEGQGRRLSFAVVVGNEPLWRVKAPTLARQVLQIAFRGRATE